MSGKVICFHKENYQYILAETTVIDLFTAHTPTSNSIPVYLLSVSL